ncbi:jg23432 [Pararge aegeria aegeria]|uniref:Jg23432 protein n=1 Tax=Pararge aegeria aegeria TaxID=348720 RepID=A0A8S4S144_9NEOP|nr:jg23432 [Pararge aegeria aegeria]
MATFELAHMGMSIDYRCYTKFVLMVSDGAVSGTSMAVESLLANASYQNQNKDDLQTINWTPGPPMTQYKITMLTTREVPDIIL